MKSVGSKIKNTNDIYDIILPYFININKEMNIKIEINENESIIIIIFRNFII